MFARTHFEIFDKNLILHSKFQKKSMLMTQYRLLSHRKWLSIRYWGMLRNALLWGPWSLKFRHLLNRWPWPNIVGCHYCCGPTKPPILDLFAITQHSILSHNKLLSIEYWVLKDTESLYFTISTLCGGAAAFAGEHWISFPGIKFRHLQVLPSVLILLLFEFCPSTLTVVSCSIVLNQ